MEIVGYKDLKENLVIREILEKKDSIEILATKKIKVRIYVCVCVCVCVVCVY